MAVFLGRKAGWGVLFFAILFLQKIKKSVDKDIG